MATDFNKPVVTDAYATLLPGLVTANKDLAMMLEPTLTGTSTNLPTGAVRWNATTVRWERYNGSSWVTLPAAGNNVYAISISGNAATATALATARTIGGVSFNGTSNINLPGVNTAGNQNTTGNAATATKLATARTIGGVSFDGTANINLPGVNTTGNQNTTGNAATATNATQLGGNLPSYYQSALGFTPVQQGTGVAQTTNVVKIGWSVGSVLKLTVDDADFGSTWPISVSGNSLTATKLANDTGSAPSYSCRAWVNFQGTGTVAIRNSGNVSSITDNGVGNYTVNFVTGMPDANYAVVSSSTTGSGNGASVTPNYIGTTGYSPLTTSFRVGTQSPVTLTPLDCDFVYLAVFR